MARARMDGSAMALPNPPKSTRTLARVPRLGWVETVSSPRRRPAAVSHMRR